MRTCELGALGEVIRHELEKAHLAREEALVCCRKAIRASGLAIRAIHRGDAASIALHLEEAERVVRRAQAVLEPFPALAAVGFLHDAEKEYAEARLTAALVRGESIGGPDETGVPVAAWLNGLAEAASELRRNLLDRLREGQASRAEELLGAMEDIYDLLVTIEYPDALTGGLRRATDALRAVVERSRSDVTATVLQLSLLRGLEERFAGGVSGAIVEDAEGV